MAGKAVLFLMICAYISCINAAGAPDCPARRAMKDFDIARFAGRWYGKININSTSSDGVKCYQDKFVRVGKEKKYETISTFIYDARTGQHRRYSGTAQLDEKSIDGKLNIVLRPSASVNITKTNFILHTDYDNFAIVTSCAKIYLGYHETHWVFARRPVLESQYLQKIFDAIKSLGWNLYSIKWVEQTCGALGWTPDEAGSP